jgi:hypothetical protein
VLLIERIIPYLAGFMPSSRHVIKSVILLDWGLVGAPVWIQIRCGFGFGFLIGGLEWILVNLTPGAPNLYPI